MPQGVPLHFSRAHQGPSGRPRRVQIYRARGRPYISPWHIKGHQGDRKGRPYVSPEHIKGNSSLGFFTGGKNAVQRCSTHRTLSLQGGFSIFHRDLMRILHLPLFLTLYTVGYIGHNSSSFQTTYYTISQVIPSQSLFYTTLPNFTLQQSICLHCTCRVLVLLR